MRSLFEAELNAGHIGEAVDGIAVGTVDRTKNDGYVVVSLGGNKVGHCPYSEFEYNMVSSRSVSEDRLKSIAERKIGKQAYFKVLGIEKGIYILSRKGLQVEAYNKIQKKPIGTVIDGWCLWVNKNGAFIDVGYGLTGHMLLHKVCKAKVTQESSMKDLGRMKCVYQGIKEDGGIRLSMIELLGTWSQNIETIDEGENMSGYINNIDGTLAYVELTPNLVCTAECRGSWWKPMDKVVVEISKIDREKKRVIAKLKSRIEENAERRFNPCYVEGVDFVGEDWTYYA
jgi:ribosomal protein S1